jgi:hypothetical protein
MLEVFSQYRRKVYIVDNVHFSLPQRNISCVYFASCEVIIGMTLNNVFFIFPILNISKRRQIVLKILNVGFNESPYFKSQIAPWEGKDRETDGHTDI